MQNKSDARVILPQFFDTVLTQFGKKIKVLRCDNAPEFNIHSLYSSFGTVLQHSCVETPQQNARVERKHQHLLNVARSILFQSHLSIHFWGECILSASYLINRTPSSILPQNITPFQALFQKSPSYSHLKVIGCLCYASTLQIDRDKFSPRASKCVLLGYPSDFRGYKFLDLETMQAIITRDVIFHVDIFPLSIQSPSVFPSSPQITSDSAAETTNPPIPPNNSVSNPSIPQPTPSDTNTSLPTTSRNGRTINPPAHLTDFICNSVSSSSSYPISSYFSLSKLSPEYLKYIVSCQPYMNLPHMLKLLNTLSGSKLCKMNWLLS